MKKQLLALSVFSVFLVGCEGTEEEKVLRLKSIAIFDQTGVQTALINYGYSASGALNRVDTYTDKGGDSVWGSVDDVLGYYSTCTFSGSGTATYRDLDLEYSPVPLKEDARIEWDALNARPVGCVDGVVDYPKMNEVTYNVAAGVPAVEEGKYQFERTGINTSRWTTQVSAVSAEANSRDFFYVTNSAGGLDGILVEEKEGTASVFIGYFKYIFNSEGRLTRREFHDDDGVNNSWGDADDGIRSYEQISRSGNQTVLKSFDGAGTDGIWFNGNDRQSAHIVYQYASGVLQSEKTSTDADVDGIWGTIDDQVTEKRFVYEEL